MNDRWRLVVRPKGLLCVAGALLMSASGVFGQVSATQQGSEPAGAAMVPEWQSAAGGRMAFEVASVREDPSGKFLSPTPFDSDDDNSNVSSIFTADLPLTSYISFAYKLSKMHPMLANLPQWAETKHFVINARGVGNPTKDQLRLMMQTLLADRFRLAIHFEAQDTPVLLMTLLKPGKLGPRLRLHADGPACDVVVPRTPGSTATLDMFPCHVVMGINLPENGQLAGARDTTVEQVGAFISNVGHMRPIVDRTGIAGKIDFSMEYTPERRGAPVSADGQADVPGTTLDEAVKDQLGLKLQAAIAPLRIPVVDHVEMPSEN